MIHVLALLAVGVLGFVVIPTAGLRFVGVREPLGATVLPWLAVSLFVAAGMLPHPAVSGSNTFLQHAVGGGAACALVSAFAALNAGVRSPLVRIVVAYAAAATLGTGVELAEFASDQFFGTRMTADTTLDMVANMIGALAAAVLLEAALRVLPSPNRAVA